MKTILSIVASAALFGCTVTPKPYAELATMSTDQLKAEWSKIHAPLTRTSGPRDYRSELQMLALQRYDFEPEERAAIEKSQIYQGMSARALFWSWGAPATVTDRSSSPYGTVERWDYSNIGLSGTSVTLRNDSVFWWHIQE